jgi:hypothetical protein
VDRPAAGSPDAESASAIADEAGASVRSGLEIRLAAGYGVWVEGEAAVVIPVLRPQQRGRPLERWTSFAVRDNFVIIYDQLDAEHPVTAGSHPS